MENNQSSAMAAQSLDGQLSEILMNLYDPNEWRIQRDYLRQEFQTVATIKKWYLEGKLLLSGSFQRDFVWNKTRQSYLIHSVLQHAPIDTIYLWQRENGVLEIVDGKQRIATILNFLGIETENIFENPLIHPGFGLRFKKNAECAFLNGVSYAELPEKYKMRIDEHILYVYIINKDVPERRVINFFINKNS